MIQSVLWLVDTLTRISASIFIWPMCLWVQISLIKIPVILHLGPTLTQYDHNLITSKETNSWRNIWRRFVFRVEFCKKKKTLFFHFLFIFHKFKIHLKFQSDYLIYEYVFTYFRLLRYVQIYITICQCKRIYCFALISRGNIYHVRTGFSCLSARNDLIPCDYIYPLSSQAFRQLSALRDTFYIA